MKQNTLPILSSLLILLIIAAAWAAYERILVKHDYAISYHIECNPEVERCYVVPCDTDSDSSCQPDIYLKALKQASDLVRECGTTLEGCENASTCLPEDALCTISACTEQNLEDGEQCSDLPLTQPAL